MKRKLALTGLILIVGMALFAAGSAHNQRIGSLKPDGTLIIKTDSVGVVISQGSANDKLDIQFSGNGRNRYDLTVKEDRGDISIEVKRKKQWFMRAFTITDATLSVRVPGTWTKGYLDAGSVSGSVKIVSPLKGIGIKVGTVSGAIEFGKFLATDYIAVRSVSGKITGDTLFANSIGVDSVSGSINLGQLETERNGSVDISTVSGRIILSKVLAQTASVKSVSGSIQSEITPSFDGKIVVKANNGSTNINVANALREDSNNRTRTFTMGRGNGLIELSSTSGRISLNN
jgi:DUF4097 and DUF4098 domain-containing protein YvlB